MLNDFLNKTIVNENGYLNFVICFIEVYFIVYIKIKDLNLYYSILYKFIYSIPILYN